VNAVVPEKQLQRRWKNSRVDMSIKILEDIEQRVSNIAFAVKFCEFDLQAEENVGKFANRSANSVRLDLEPFRWRCRITVQRKQPKNLRCPESPAGPFRRNGFIS
jgi:hypothetical protein